MSPCSSLSVTSFKIVFSPSAHFTKRWQRSALLRDIGGTAWQSRKSHCSITLWHWCLSKRYLQIICTSLWAVQVKSWRNFILARNYFLNDDNDHSYKGKHPPFETNRHEETYLCLQTHVTACLCLPVNINHLIPVSETESQCKFRFYIGVC